MLVVDKLPLNRERKVSVTTLESSKLEKSVVWSVMPLFLFLLLLGVGTRIISGAASSSQVDVGGGLLMTAGTGLIYILALVVIVKNFSVAITLTQKSAGILFLFIIFTLMSALWSQYPQKVLLNWGHTAGLFLIALSAALATRQSKFIVSWTIVWATFFILSGAIAAALLLPHIGLDRELMFRWQGFTPNPNSLGAFALLAVWGVICTLNDKKNVWRIALQAVVIVMAVICLWGANSITSIILSLFVISSVPICQYVLNINPRVRNVRLALLLVALALLLAGVYAFNPKLFDYEYLLNIIGRDSTLTGRTTLWEIADAAIALKPWLGWSFDTHLSASRVLKLNIIQFHNGYLDLLVMGGWVGLVFILTLIISLLIRVLRLSATDPRFAALFVTLAAVILVHNITEASFARPRNILWLMLMYIFLASDILRRFVVKAREER